MLGSLGISDMFDLIIGADEVSASKPNPEMIHKILGFYSYNAKVDKAWMIGDNSKDMMSASNAKIDGLFATWGFSPKTKFEDRVDKPLEILTVVL